jgi:hypothetical protein
MNRILQSIFKILNFLPLFQMLFLWLNKTPPKRDPPLRVQEGFDIPFLKYYFLPLLNTIGYQMKIFNTKFLNLVVVRSFCFGLISPPFWHESPKTESLEPSKCFLPLWSKIKELRLYQRRSAVLFFDAHLPQEWRVGLSDDEA